MNNLEIETKEWHDPKYRVFKIGTKEALYGIDEETYTLIPSKEQELNPGTFDAIIEAFEFFCKTDGKDLKIVEIEIPNFMFYLIEKKGFKKLPNNDLIKNFK